MNRLFLHAFLGASLFGANVQGASAQNTHSFRRPLNVALLVYHGVEPLDLSGPLDVFVKANDLSSHSFNVYTVGLSRVPVKSQANVLTLSPQFSLDDCPRPDIVLVPGASTGVAQQTGSNPRVIKWLQSNHQPSQTVMSVCTGAFILGRAGLLDGKNSTTHWMVQGELQRQFPRTKAFAGARFIKDGNILSTAGVTSGIDGALQLVEQTRGKEVADNVARAIQYRRGTPTFPEQSNGRVQLRTFAPAKATTKLALDFDPVCHMKVAAYTKTTFTYKGQTYGFCSPGCRDAFASQPQQFLKSK